MTGRAQAAPLRLGRYLLHHELAAGGMATVHLASLTGQAGFRRLVAIKRMHPHLARNPEFVEMFMDEAHLASRLRHPHVVPVIDVVDAEGELLLVMEYVLGVSLAQLVDAARECQEPLPHAVSVRIICDALEGLHAAHQERDDQGRPLGIVHRDFSPQNLMISSDGSARVLDFGIAKAASNLHVTSADVVRGKANYMAPEQLLGQTVDARVDVYSAGITLWELLVGRRAFARASEAEVARQLQTNSLPSAHEAAPEVPMALSEVVGRAMDPDRDARYASALEFAEALEAVTQVATPRAVARVVRRLAADTIEQSEARSREVSGEQPRSTTETVLDVVRSEAQTSPDNLTPAEARPSARTPRRSTARWAALAALSAIGLGLWSLRSTAPERATPQVAATSGLKPTSAHAPAAPAREAIATPSGSAAPPASTATAPLASSSSNGAQPGLKLQPTKKPRPGASPEATPGAPTTGPTTKKPPADVDDLLGQH